MDEVEKLRRRVIQERRGGSGRDGKAYSTKLRREVSAYLQAARAKGMSPNQLGPALGLSIPTAYEWSSKAPTRKGKPSSKAFRQIVVAAEPTATTRDESNVVSRIVVTGPGGLQASGLGVAELAELLRRLGC